MLKRLLFVLLVTSVAVFAGTVSLDFVFSNPAGAGQVNFLGGTNQPLTGTIPMDYFKAAGTSHDGQYDLTGGQLQFTTGNFVSSNAGIMSFAAGGSIVIIGQVPDAGITTTTTLLSGSNVAATLLPNGAMYVTLVNGTDTKDPGLLTYLGVPTNTQFWFSGYVSMVSPTLNAAGGFTSPVAAISADVTNSNAPEPSSWLFIGAGLVAVAFSGRRYLRH